MGARFSHIVGIDDAPFEEARRGDVAIVGAVFCGLRLEGVLRGRVRHDGANATRSIVQMLEQSRFHTHLQVILLQGIALAGFNVVDIHGLHASLGIPVLAVCRKRPDMKAIRAALLHKVRGGQRKWRLIEQAGPVRYMEKVYVQSAGLTQAEAGELIRDTAVNSMIPEPLRTAHLIAASLAGTHSRQRV